MSVEPLDGLQRLLPSDDPQLAMLDAAVRDRAVTSRRFAGLPGGWQAPSPDELHDLDLDRVAADLIASYPAEHYPAVVLGAGHGAAIHLAALLGAAWLPSGIDIAVRPSADPPERLLSAARSLATDLRATAPQAGLSQRFSVGTGESRLTLGWGRLPGPYRDFLGTRLLPDAPIIVVRDVHPVVVLRDAADLDVQLECPVPTADHTTALIVATGESGAATRPGFAADVLHLARASGHTAAQLLFNAADRLSALVADVTRALLREAGRPDSWLVVQHGRRIDARVLGAGAVPYWCADSGPQHSAQTEWWLAASRSFDHIEVALDPGVEHTATGIAGWMSVCRFAERSATVDLLDRPSETPEAPPSHTAVCNALGDVNGADVLWHLAELADRSGVLLDGTA